MAGKKLYIADWHYGHGDVISSDTRPFRDLEHMHSELIGRWNMAVEPEDTVYCLGDMFFCEPSEACAVLDKLNGKKILVRGEHDTVDDLDLMRRFDMVTDYLEIDDAGRNVVLCHYPIPCFNGHLQNQYHLYGHVHLTFEHGFTLENRHHMEFLGFGCNMYNVGAMILDMDYTPRTLDEIVKGEGGKCRLSRLPF